MLSRYLPENVAEKNQDDKESNRNLICALSERGPGIVDGIATDWLRAGRSGDRIPMGGEIFRTCPDRPWGPPILLYNGYRVFPGGKERPGRDTDPHPLLVPLVMKE
jgi:hypothetical protein